MQLNSFTFIVFLIVFDLQSLSVALDVDIALSSFSPKFDPIFCDTCYISQYVFANIIICKLSLSYLYCAPAKQGLNFSHDCLCVCAKTEKTTDQKLI